MDDGRARRWPNGASFVRAWNISDAMLGIIFVAFSLLYACGLLAGWWFAKTGRIDYGKLVQTPGLVTDPLTAWFQRWHDRVKIASLRQKRWMRLWLVISANNLLAVAFVTRTLYGASIVLPVYVTLRQGLAHGTVFVQPTARPRGTLLLVAALEFGAYMMATALGVITHLRAPLVSAVRGVPSPSSHR